MPLEREKKTKIVQEERRLKGQSDVMCLAEQCGGALWSLTLLERRESQYEAYTHWGKSRKTSCSLLSGAKLTLAGLRLSSDPLWHTFSLCIYFWRLFCFSWTLFQISLKRQSGHFTGNTSFQPLYDKHRNSSSHFIRNLYHQLPFTLQNNSNKMASISFTSGRAILVTLLPSFSLFMINI